eukprot:CAMPEP_0173414528 /NCGR_PEP_ID=MMETSP1356-20130122/84375_1 /TAXON_ID=77927 ORGANISM="Hemiselmis virescens, Strain PCC157" /NCGR_SAMPLE_ID=MMETSP1356 /ASSEMBLY_ACC=CAM_ASM_000847 /LENGTH=149 /DNA_ID=CAMNT_0014376715 /DNA_START=77 /DNA_END=526 /DNA_ORIENTATION=-
MSYLGKAEGSNPEFSQKLVHTTIGSGGIGFLLGSTRGMLNEPLMETSASMRSVTAKSWNMAAREASLFAVLGAVYVTTEATAKDVRGTDDGYNRMIGACVVGLTAGARKGSFPQAAMACPAFAAVSAMIDACDATLRPPMEWQKEKHRY